MSKEIKNRIKSMEATRQITKAMEMVAASKLRRAQAQVNHSRPYFETLRTTIEKIAASNRDFSSPYLFERDVERAMYIVIAGDRGLAGGYNSNVLKLEEAEIGSKNTMVLPIGKKSVDYFRSRKVKIFSEGYAEAADMDISDCFDLARQICNAYLNSELDEVSVVYTHFVSVLSQVPTVMKILPLTRDDTSASHCDTLYEPSADAVFAAIVPEYLGGVLYGALCESRASEQAARRTAMESATSNADEMISDLRLKFNRARQASITQEITEIVAGS